MIPFHECYGYLGISAMSNMRLYVACGCNQRKPNSRESFRSLEAGFSAHMAAEQPPSSRVKNESEVRRMESIPTHLSIFSSFSFTTYLSLTGVVIIVGLVRLVNPTIIGALWPVSNWRCLFFFPFENCIRVDVEHTCPQRRYHDWWHAPDGSISFGFWFRQFLFFFLWKVRRSFGTQAIAMRFVKKSCSSSSLWCSFCVRDRAFVAW